MTLSSPKTVQERITQAREEERKQLARELHDQIIQALIAVSYHLASVQHQFGSDVDCQLAQVQMSLRRILNDVRDICTNLRTPPLRGMDLAATIQAHICEIRDYNAFAIALQITGDTDQPISEEIVLCLFRVLQEALANVCKHAEAGHVTVCLDIAPHEVSLSVRDDGKGFRVPLDWDQLLQQQRFGLVGMRERIELVDGTLQLATQPSSGTALTACVPLHQAVLAMPGRVAHRHVISEATCTST